jgi:hypothetical protein
MEKRPNNPYDCGASVVVNAFAGPSQDAKIKIENLIFRCDDID